MTQQQMEYRRLGRTGIKVSVLSFGSWVTFDNQLKDDLAMECMQAAHDAGCNFFDNAEVYAGGESEAIMGRVLAELGWPRWSYVLTTKVFWGIHDAPNMRNTLNRKYLMQAIDGSLERLGVDFVDVLYCHRADPDTTLEETVWAMSDIVSSGKALYWGTSEWAADEIRGAIEIAERHHLHKPVTEQPQYNLLDARAGRAGVRPAVRRDRATGRRSGARWPPACSPASTATASRRTRAARWRATAGWPRSCPTSGAIAKVERLRPIADELGCSLAQLALAWCTTNPNVSTVITGASRPSQVVENFDALDVIAAARRRRARAHRRRRQVA